MEEGAGKGSPSELWLKAVDGTGKQRSHNGESSFPVETKLVQMLAAHVMMDVGLGARQSEGSKKSCISPMEFASP
eukprot:6205136-Pleurochrysis_carterae.AAC.4